MLSMPSLLELVNVFERSGVGIPGSSGDSQRGMGRWDMQRISPVIARELEPWLECIGYASQMWVDCGDDRVEVELEETCDPAFYRYRCPETFRYVPIAADQVAINTVTPAKFLHVMADWLAIPKALRKGIDAPAIEQVLWYLGKASLGAAHVDIWLVRNLPWWRDDVFEYLSSPTLPNLGIVLSTSRPQAKSVSPPRQYRIVPLEAIWVQGVETPAIDKVMLYQCLNYAPGNPLPKTLPVHWDSHTQTLSLNTRSEKPWVIKGDKQAAAVNYLYQQALNDRWWVPAYEILQAVYPSQTMGRSARMQNLFRGNPLWELYLARDGHGHYGFRMK